jgi:hypothetical protein
MLAVRQLAEAVPEWCTVVNSGGEVYARFSQLVDLKSIRESVSSFFKRSGS